jgi:hypothetical protein
MKIKTKVSTIAAALALSVAAPLARADHVEMHADAKSMDVYYSVGPADSIRAYPVSSVERRMHGGVPAGHNHRHLMISVFDAKTKDRIDDATVTARVAELAMAGETRRLQPMTLAGTVTYGNYFRMIGRGPFLIDVRIQRPLKPPVQTSFEYFP